jgi:mono/diheme cytochrome c family protein
MDFALRGACLSALFALAACAPPEGGWPGVTEDPRQAALTIYPELPPTQEILELREQGSRLFPRFGCAACHSPDDERRGLLGPPLGGVLERNLPRWEYSDLETRRWMVRHIRNPQEFPGVMAEHPDYARLHMPPHSRISDADMKALVEYLASLR